MSKWPMKADSAPSVDEIAKALWMAADLTGEREVLAERSKQPGGGLDGVRARWAAIVALNTLYPRCHMDALGRLFGAKSGVANVLSAKRTTWWPSPRELEDIIAAI